MVPGREALDVFVPAMSFDDRGKAPSWNRFQQIAEHRILVAHAKHSFLSLFNQKDTTKPRSRLACSHNSLTRSPDSPARKRESRTSKFQQLPGTPCFRAGDEKHLLARVPR